MRATVAVLAVLALALAGVAVADAQQAPSAPDAPTAVSAVPGGRSATVSWTAPEATGGSPITGYTVVALPMGGSTTAAPRQITTTTPATSLVFTGLTEGVSYGFLVAAKNTDIAQFGPYSSVSPTIILARKPAAPVITDTEPGAKSITVTWTEPQSDAPITSYRVTASATRADGTTYSTTRSVTAATPGDPVPTTVTIVNLQVGLSYRFTVTATSLAGTSAASAPSELTPLADVPEAPSVTEVTMLSATSLRATWDAPESSLPITKYVVTVAATRPDGTEHRLTKSPVPIATSITVTGLTPGLLYLVSVAAVSDAGTGLSSPPRAPGDATGPLPPSATRTTLSGTGSYGCLVEAAGGVRCWGPNSSGQLGDGTTTASPVPVAVSGISDAAAVDSGLAFSCALHTTGSVSCWGSNNRGQLGNGTTTASPVPVAVSGIDDAVAIGVGTSHACAVRGSGSVSCWGFNQNGQLGNGSTTQSTTPVDVSGLADALGVSGGATATCAVRSGGAVSCWGDNTSGQLGVTGVSQSTVPVAVVGLDDATSVSAGERHACAVRAAGGASCWGDNQWSQLSGTGGGLRTVAGLTGVVRLSAGTTHTCAVLSNLTGRCWGSNLSGQLANEIDTTSSSPIPIANMTGLTDVVASDSHTCMAKAPGTIHCSGATYGDWPSPTPVLIPGTGPQVDRAPVLTLPRPVERATGPGGAPVSFSATATDDLDGSVPVTCSAASGDTFPLGPTLVTCSAVDSGGNTTNGGFIITVIASGLARLDGGTDHTCQVVDGGTVRCWGDGANGKLGHGSNASSTTPVSVSGLTDAISVAAGIQHTCALTSAGAVWCWGSGSGGRLGNGGTTSSNVPVPVTGLADVVSVAAGDTHTCAVTTSGTAHCWGSSAGGALGPGNSSSTSTPVAIASITDAVAVSASGGTHTCVLRSAGTVQCWAGTTTWSGVAGAVAVAAGQSHGCALLGTGRVQCWGQVSNGQLGNGGSGVATPPTGAVEVNGVRDGVSLSSHGVFTCVATATGSTRCWGKGPITSAASVIATRARTIVDLPAASAVTVGGTHACAVLTTGQTRCWGANAKGQLGNGKTTDAFPPVAVSG